MIKIVIGNSHSLITHSSLTASNSVSGNPVAMLVSTDTPAAITAVTTQAAMTYSKEISSSFSMTGVTMNPAGMVEIRFWQNVRNALIPAAFQNFLDISFISF